MVAVKFRIVLLVVELLLLLIIWGYLYYSSLSRDLEKPLFFGVVILIILLLGTWINLFGIIYINISLAVLIVALPFARKEQFLDFGIGRSVAPTYIIVGILVGIVFGILYLVFTFSSIKFSLITFPSLIKILQISVIEELIFRGLLLGYMRRGGVNSSVANFVQAVIFLGGHLGANPLQWDIVLVVLFAWIAGLFVIKTKSVKAPIVMHFVANMISA